MKLAFALLLALVVPASAESQVSNYLYLNRCKGSCTVHGGFDDARAMSSSIPCAGAVTCGNGGCSCNGGTGGDYVIDEFKSSTGQIGAAADAEWNAIVQCVREVYSPYDITVSDEPPPGGMSHTQGIVAGRPANINYGNASIGGIAPGSLACAPQDNVISFSFANIYSGSNRIIDICATAAQETAHSFGLDHAFAFTDGRSACPDPMSYRSDCGSTQRFFRNDNVTCGEFAARACRCGGFQNSHLRLLSIFGEGTPLTAPPALHLDMPADGDTIQNGVVVFATASAQRGVFRLELWLNGYKWATAKGAPFGSAGQPQTQYSLMFPPTVPDGVIDIVVKAFDDIEAETDSPMITVTKGAPCASADACAKGQQCDAGRCFWETPTGVLGDACTYPQFCESGNCLAASDGQYCSQDCVVGVADSCPMGFACAGEEGRAGFCVHDGDGGAGCCSIGDDGRSAALLSLFVAIALCGRRANRRSR
jgi:hypothetical protein